MLFCRRNQPCFQPSGKRCVGLRHSASEADGEARQRLWIVCYMHFLLHDLLDGMQQVLIMLVILSVQRAHACPLP